VVKVNVLNLSDTVKILALLKGSIRGKMNQASPVQYSTPCPLSICGAFLSWEPYTRGYKGSTVRFSFTENFDVKF
jgi:hypothetical protein